MREADKALLQAPLRGAAHVLEAAQRLLEQHSPALGPLGQPARALGTRLLDATLTLVDAATGILRDVLRTLVEAPLGLARGMTDSLRMAARGQWRGAGRQLGHSLWKTGLRLTGGAVDIFIRALQGTANAVLTLGFLEPPSRPLHPAERQLLARIFGDALDCTVVRLKRGGATDWARLAPHVVGNTLYLPCAWGGALFHPDGTLTEACRETFIHEAAHVWQNQNSGGSFVHRALLAQLLATLRTGSRSGAYAWRQGFARGQSFLELNPEQQASLVEEIGLGLKHTPSGVASAWRPPLSQAERAYVLAAWEQVKRGEG
ncbi:hypothetical protein POL68_31260 [Stigmatella sp. ncwal1]|uniref:DUF4157 domain-containing protein n=1 Tax=Stigmatella ashevillensis TaxID=2995309 RepID=A0ABT5DKV1_9BACT|nr:hypothetical protein [Stigmatella ashevillena]MDC0712982.1 hypothetical protein [Stigmatella ashevillena]